MINVLKIFDLVFIIAPGSSQDDANVLALQLYRTSLRRRTATRASAARSRVLLLLLVIPVMLVQHPPAAEGGAAMTTMPSSVTGRAGRRRRSARRVARLAARRAARAAGVMRVFLVLVGLFWLVPTIGLLLSSLRDPTDIAGERLVEGLHRAVASSPSTTTQTLLENDDDHRLAAQHAS